MRKKLAIGLGGFLLIFLGLKIYAETMPDYGIESSWKKLVLKTLLSDDVPKISVQDAHAKKDSVLFLDTRSAEEFGVSHLAGARFAGYEEFDLASLKDIPLTQPIITYCSIGKRSNSIAKQLAEAGYTQVHNMYGGMFEWVNKGYLIVDAQNQPTEKVHAFNRAWGLWLERGNKVY